MATLCPSTYNALDGSRVACILPAGHQHALDAAERLQQQHDGLRRDGVRVTWLGD